MISVAMAFYNGKRYIKKQADSILNNLGSGDELIISVDDDRDGSKEILETMAKEDSRIRLIKGPGKGVVENFQNAFRSCRGDIIFLADQDDAWKPGKVRKIKKVFEDPNIVCVVHNAQIADENLKPLGETTFQWRDSGPGFWKNMKKNSYIGCCMALRREALDQILPIPENVWIHDQWIGLLAEQLGTVVFFEEPLLLYRRHGGNVTGLTHGSVTSMVKKRYYMLKEIKRRVREWKV